MKIIFSTNVPSPYRVDFFNEFGKYCDLTVLYERHSSAERDAAWKGSGAENFDEVYLDLKLVGADRSKGSALKDYVKTHTYDKLIFTNYVSPATIEAIIWCRIHGRKYYIEYDGGFNKKDSCAKGLIKKILLRGAVGHLTTADEHIDYLKSIGIRETIINKYPFSSIKQADIDKAKLDAKNGKQYFRDLLGIKEERVVIAVGQFIPRKGFDVLLKSAHLVSKTIGFYIIGGEPTPEYLQKKESMKLSNVHFVGFKKKNELSLYYQAADCTAFPTREDIWGLITNESLAFGVPVVATERCISALEMIKDGHNGFIVPVEDYQTLATKIENAISVDMKAECINTAQKYTIEEMAKAHKQILNL